MALPTDIKEEEMWHMYTADRNYSSDEEAMVSTLFEEIPQISSHGAMLHNLGQVDDRQGRKLHRPRERQRDSVRISPEKSIARERSTVDSAGNITLMTETVYKCNKCDKTFYTRSGYRKHQRNHTEENSYVCNTCGDIFIDWSSFNMHKDSHTGGRPWACSACDKRFKLQSHLIRHERSHARERPYTCNVCGKCFGQRSNLTTHMKIHTVDIPYICID